MLLPVVISMRPNLVLITVNISTLNVDGVQTHSRCVLGYNDIPVRICRTWSARRHQRKGRPSRPCTWKWHSCTSVSVAWSYPFRSHDPHAYEYWLHICKWVLTAHMQMSIDCTYANAMLINVADSIRNLTSTFCRLTSCMPRPFFQQAENR